MKRILLLLIVVFTGLAQNLKGQSEQINLCVEEANKIDVQKSFDDFGNENMYMSSYWEYRYFKADRLPSISLNTTPFDYNHYRRKEYNFETNTDEYVLRDYFNSDLSVQVDQKVGLTGGSFFVNSGIGMVKNLSGEMSTSYQSVPINIGYLQELNGYNALRWQSKIEPIKFEKAKKEFIQSQENLAMKSTSMFFDLVEAQIQQNIARNNLANADTLYKIGQ